MDYYRHDTQTERGLGDQSDLEEVGNKLRSLSPINLARAANPAVQTVVHIDGLSERYFRLAHNLKSERGIDHDARSPLSLFKTPPKEYSGDYQEHLVEQYRLYVEMSDRVSARRALSNTFFLAANTLLLSLISVLSRFLLQQSLFSTIISILVLAGPIAFCLMWRALLSSYQKLNAAKFEVISELESRLPASPFDYEWGKLGRGKDLEKYRPLTSVERAVPLIFVAMYSVLALVLLLATQGVVKT
jgi:hypothetical protein